MPVFGINTEAASALTLRNKVELPVATGGEEWTWNPDILCGAGADGPALMGTPSLVGNDTKPGVILDLRHKNHMAFHACDLEGKIIGSHELPLTAHEHIALMVD